MFYASFDSLMFATGLITVASVTFLVFAALSGMMTLIAGHLPGAGGATKAFFWAVLLVVLIMPWDRILSRASHLPMGIPSFADLIEAYRAYAQMAGPNFLAPPSVDMYLRFALIPILMVLVTIMYLGRTSQANSQVSASLSAMQSVS